MDFGLPELNKVILDTTKRLGATLRRLTAAAKEGRLRALRDRVNECTGLYRDLGQSLSAPVLNAAIEQTERLANANLIAELLTELHDQGVIAVEDNEVIYCYPHVIQVYAKDGYITIGRSREIRLRPSVVAKLLLAEQKKPSRFKPQAFLEVLFDCYSLLVPRDALQSAGFVIPLARVYQALTPLPGQSAQYTVTDFGRDVFLLDRSGVSVTKAGAVLSLPASTGTRSAAINAVTESGELKRYYGISFNTPESTYDAGTMVENP